jgi:hypothetical protein
MALLTALPLSLLLVVGGGHSSLHPADANIYLELPQPQQAIAAYPQAGLMQLLHDPSVTALVAKLSGEDPEGFDMDALLEEGVEGALQGSPELALVFSLAGDARSASLSLSQLHLDGLGEKLASSDFALTPEVLEHLEDAQLRVVLGYEGAAEGELAAAFQNMTNLLRLPLGDGDLVRGEGEREELELQVWSGEALFGREVFLAEHGSQIVMGAGAGAAGRFLSEAATLESDADFQSCGSSFGETEGVVLYDLYVNATDATELGETLSVIDPELTMAGDLLGVATGVAVPGDHFQERWRTQLVAGRFIAETSSIDHGREAGVQPLLGVSPLESATFGMLPADAAAVWATTINKQGLEELLVRTLSQAAGGDPETVLAELESGYGLDPRRDVIDPMGDSMVFYTMPFSGIGAPKMFVALELEDPQAFAAGMERFGEAAAAVSDGALSFNSKPYRKNPFMALSIASSELGAPGPGTGVAESIVSSLASGVAVGIVEGRAILSLSNIYTKREMKRLIQGGGEPHALAGEGLSLPDGATSYTVTDWGAILDSLYSSLKGMFPLLQQGMGDILPFSMEELPADGIFSRYMKPTVNWSKQTERGTYSHSDASFGPELPALLSVGIATMVFVSTDSTDEFDDGFVIAEAEESFEQPSGGEQSEITRVTLSGVKVGIVVFKADRGAYPASLEDLVTPTADFPDGYIGSKGIPLDGWGQELHYSLAEDGASFKLWSSGPNGIDESGAGDDQSLPSRKAQ